MDREEAQKKIRALTSGMVHSLMDGGGAAFWKPRAKEALALSRLAYGQVSSETASITRALAIIETELGNHEEAGRLFQQARGIYDEMDGPMSMNSVEMNLGTATARFFLGDVEKALNICFDRQNAIERAIADDPRKCRPVGSNIDLMSFAYTALLNWLLKFGIKDQAIIQAKSLYRYDREQNPCNVIDVVNSAFRLAGALRQARRLEEALPFYREAIAIGDAPGFPEWGGHSGHVSDLAACLFELGRLEEAEEQMRVSIALCEKFKGASAYKSEKLDYLSKILAAKGDRIGALSALQEAKNLHDQVEKSQQFTPHWIKRDRIIQARLKALSEIG
jgi:tetratricopeptide (TPR) repeat protein